MKPRKHLDYEREYLGCEIKNCAPDFLEVSYWPRDRVPQILTKEESYYGYAVQQDKCR